MLSKQEENGSKTQYYTADLQPYTKGKKVIYTRVKYYFEGKLLYKLFTPIYATILCF